MSKIPSTLDEAIAVVEKVDEKAAFALKALKVARQANVEDGYPERKGMHVVYSGFNSEFQRRFGETSQPTTEALEKTGVVTMRPSRGGPTMYFVGDAPALTGNAKMKNAIANI